MEFAVVAPPHALRKVRAATANSTPSSLNVFENVLNGDLDADPDEDQSAGQIMLAFEEVS
jgi:hypothetical protein